jgi:hypothetical protein
VEKHCRICGELRPLTDFHRASTARDGHRGECKDCFREISRARYKANPDAAKERARLWQQENPERHRANQRARRQRPEVKAREREGHLRRKFQLTAEQYEEMLSAQRGVCAICGREPKPGKALHVDHNHETGAVRGLVCFSCNSALGNLHEDEQRISALLTYLIAHDPEQVELAAMTRRRLAALAS